MAPGRSRPSRRMVRRTRHRRCMSWISLRRERRLGRSAHVEKLPRLCHRWGTHTVCDRLVDSGANRRVRAGCTFRRDALRIGPTCRLAHLGPRHPHLAQAHKCMVEALSSPALPSHPELSSSPSALNVSFNFYLPVTPLKFRHANRYSNLVWTKFQCCFDQLGVRGMTGSLPAHCIRPLIANLLEIARVSLSFPRWSSRQ
ncbi:hypothetical protein V8E55_008235 [Tylopilus felleus]